MTRQVKLALFFGAKEFSLIAQVCQKIAIAVYVGLEPLQLADQRAFGFFVFRIEGADLLVQQIAEEGRWPGARDLLALPRRDQSRVASRPRARGTYVQPISCAYCRMRA